MFRAALLRVVRAAAGHLPNHCGTLLTFVANVVCSKLWHALIVIINLESL